MRLVKEVRDFLDYDATVIGDGGDIVTFAARVLEINGPGHWLDPGQFGCLGAGSGFAAAAQLARPGKQVCIIYGRRRVRADRIRCRELRASQPADRVDRRQQRRVEPDHPGCCPQGGSGVGTYLSQETDYAQIMQGLGGYGERVTDPEEIKPALERAFGAGKAALLDVVIGPRSGVRRHGRPVEAVKTILVRRGVEHVDQWSERTSTSNGSADGDPGHRLDDVAIRSGVHDDAGRPGSRRYQGLSRSMATTAGSLAGLEVFCPTCPWGQCLLRRNEP